MDQDNGNDPATQGDSTQPIPEQPADAPQGDGGSVGGDVGGDVSQPAPPASPAPDGGGMDTPSGDPNNPQQP